MTETDPENTPDLTERYERSGRVPDDREDSAGPGAPTATDPGGPPAQIPDDRKASARSGMPEEEGE
ncbi:hypothetical protein HS048_28095 [Planomonospora sp. ID91781]|jgi:hypothetical protein|uniref:Uncharacterized protein n=3 Tax=Planomonospora TaxID=1998 RepID=A0A171DF67_9ACTN|nr:MULTISPECIES: hypothetical protein [Planomonospora]MBG0824574.1 hypothetical protein [Planomonospora sp. ID91781]GAT68208.1 hypothetical protein PS9374_03869 [Planomonospora sphaerica]